MNRIFLSPPCVGEEEREAVRRAFDSGYVAPCGPMVDALERELATLSSRTHAVAVSSGTAALDLAMAELQIDESWLVIAPSLTFIATVGPASHRGAKLAFIDSDQTMNMDLALLEECLENNKDAKKLIIGVDLYGRTMDYARLSGICSRYGAALVMDSAEAVGARTADGANAGSAGVMAVYSFNGNKIVTTSGGGALLTDDAQIAARARSRSQQSRENVPWYEHKEVGYNYRMSNLLASVGLAQLKKLEAFISRRSEICSIYRARLSGRLQFPAPAPGENNWLALAFAEDSAARDNVIARLEKANIESRPVWKPMHLQEVFRGASVFGGAKAQDFFSRGICLPTGSGMSNAHIERVLEALK